MRAHASKSLEKCSKIIAHILTYIEAKVKTPFWAATVWAKFPNDKKYSFFDQISSFFIWFFSFFDHGKSHLLTSRPIFAIRGDFCTIWQKSLDAKIILVSKVIFLYFYKKCKNFLCVIFNHFICQKCTNLGAYFLHLEITIFSRFLRFRSNQGLKFTSNALLNLVFTFYCTSSIFLHQAVFCVFPSSKIDQK